MATREGRSILIEWRSACRRTRCGALAAELVRLPVDVIVVSGARRHGGEEATSTIPIVFVTVGDPVGLGLVASLAPPGNVTGTANLWGPLPKAAGAAEGGRSRTSRVACLCEP